MTESDTHMIRLTLNIFERQLDIQIWEHGFLTMGMRDGRRLERSWDSIVHFLLILQPKETKDRDEFKWSQIQRERVRRCPNTYSIRFERLELGLKHMEHLQLMLKLLSLACCVLHHVVNLRRDERRI